MMTLTEALASTRFIVNSQGQRTDVVLPLEAWEALMSWLEDLEDTAVVGERWADRKTRAGWPTLDEVESELKSDGLL
jgi:hypothetical protein